MIALQPNPERYSEQLKQKQERFQQQFSEFKLPNIDIFPSRALCFRHRADFTLWHVGDELHYAVFPNGKRGGPTFVSDFPIASERINQLMTELLPRLQSNDILRRKLFQINFHTSLAGDALVTLTYHRALDDLWQQQAQILSDELSISLVGRSKKQKVIIGRDYVNETFIVGKKALHYQQPEGCFTQSNALICQDMLNWVDIVLEKDSKSHRDLLELYCGNGNFTLAMAKHFDRVLATELVKGLTAVAKINCQKNNIDNVELVRMAAEDVVDAINNVRPFRRMRDIDLDSYQFTTLFVDPPRCGMDAICRGLAQTFDSVLYISCNPDTLKLDIDVLQKTHQIEGVALFDQFPYTHHAECGMWLTKRS